MEIIMLKRVITGIVAFLVFLPFIIFSDTVALPIGLGLCAAIAVWEAFHCVGLHKNLWLSLPLYPIAAAAPICMRCLGIDTTLTMAVVAIFVLMLYTYAVCVFSKGKVDISAACTALVTCLYTMGGFAAIIYLHDFHAGGRFLYLLTFIGAWITDIFAYFSGRLFGKHKLIPEISPKKTVEGSIGGILFCVLAFLGFTYIYNTWLVGFLPDAALPEVTVTLPYVLMAVVGFVVSIVSQIGDLSMSAIKRHYGVKDFGKLFPGHGGVLDRFDSVLAVAIILACALGMLL